MLFPDVLVASRCAIALVNLSSLWAEDAGRGELGLREPT